MPQKQLNHHPGLRGKSLRYLPQKSEFEGEVVRIEVHTFMAKPPPQQLTRRRHEKKNDSERRAAPITVRQVWTSNKQQKNHGGPPYYSLHSEA